MTPKELQDAIEYNAKEVARGGITDEHIVQLVEHWQATHGLNADGWCGPNTQASLDGARVVSLEDLQSKAGYDWEPFDGPLERQPRNRKEVYQIFGNPGSGSADMDWRRKNIVECHGDNRLPGVPAKWYVQIHRMIEPYLREALRRAQLAAPNYKIERLGGYVFRHIRHNPKNPLSMHSWGIAVDVDPHKNYSRTFKPRGTGPKAWLADYMEIWPDGVPMAFVRAFQSCGFAWGSDWDEDGISTDHTYYDPMHFEFVARDGDSMNV